MSRDDDVAVALRRATHDAYQIGGVGELLHPASRGLFERELLLEGAAERLEADLLQLRRDVGLSPLVARGSGETPLHLGRGERFDVALEPGGIDTAGFAWPRGLRRRRGRGEHEKHGAPR